MIELSIIVPVYNVENYLVKCIDSIVQQSRPSYLDDSVVPWYEIIMVDDGSTDGSGKLADSLANSPSAHLATSPRIKVIHQENKGLSEARNAGLNIACGRYIQFVDSDDYLVPNVVAQLLEQLQQNDLEVLRYKYQHVNELGQLIIPNKTTDPHVCEDYSSIVVDGVSYLNQYMGVACYACQFIIRRDVLNQDNNGLILFEKGIYFEDTEWTPRMLIKAKRVSGTETVVYNYLVREGSITRTNNKDKKRKIVSDKLSIIASLLEEKKSLTSDKCSWFDMLIAWWVVNIISTLATDLYDERYVYLNRLNELGVIPVNTERLWKSAQRKATIINVSPKMAILLFRLAYQLRKRISNR